MTEFIMAVTCPICSETIIKNDGIVSDFTTPDSDIPIVNLSLFSCTTFTCEECGTKVYVGEDECMYEYEEGDIGE